MTLTHRMTNTPTYKSWLKMIYRCHNPRAVQFKWYGGKGVAVCDRWRRSFEAFLSDMGVRPAGTSIDRIDGSKGYEPGNCRWASPLVQMRNQSTTVIVEWQGKRVSLRDLADEHGLRFGTVYQRYRSGHSVESALFGRRARLSDEARAIILASPDLPGAQLARQLGVSKERVYYARKHFGKARDGSPKSLWAAP